MSKNWKSFFLKITLALLFLYIFSYLINSYFGKRESFSWDGKVWSFGGTRQMSEYYYPVSKKFQPELLENERKLCSFYRPFIVLDALLSKDRHIYSENAPECGK